MVPDSTRRALAGAEAEDEMSGLAPGVAVVGVTCGTARLPTSAGVRSTVDGRAAVSPTSVGRSPAPADTTDPAVPIRASAVHVPMTIPVLRRMPLPYVVGGFAPV
ncbi:hypothetical protein GCM10010112_52750 [Actinoplanes lobatus]|uniref:Uncharacterized protein n=1 Tax=Actinoplanes lobatus TaxID=113568 RepID=A0ABQ4ANK5_9ACTN|nr:hypothetical protein GCM10010112_52750 [Actinoplanes lobatus]GIE42588.1 hypothetical protein Alo02nite_54860 [Actinoplanes lobatus]